MYFHVLIIISYADWVTRITCLFIPSGFLPLLLSVCYSSSPVCWWPTRWRGLSLLVSLDRAHMLTWVDGIQFILHCLWLHDHRLPFVTHGITRTTGISLPVTVVIIFILVVVWSPWAIFQSTPASERTVYGWARWVFWLRCFQLTITSFGTPTSAGD